jgi:thiosulfate dehydrogenase
LQDKKHTDLDKHFIKHIPSLLIFLFVIILVFSVHHNCLLTTKKNKMSEEILAAQQLISKKNMREEIVWVAPDTSLINKEANAQLIRYGKQLITNTAYYFGPLGKIKHLNNGMNCQNCHLEAGTKAFGNNYGAVASTYPKFRERSCTIETIHKRVNDCFERSLNGKALDSTSQEMKAIVTYIKWVGKDVAKGKKTNGAGLKELTFIDRAANPDNGKHIYDLKCASCHAENGEGKLQADNITYQYPPLWGDNSFNIGAGLYRLSRFAAYIKYNMPLGANYQNPQLTDEEAWDVAAFVNSQTRPQKKFNSDWPIISMKPVDHPFGPYADNFSETQHKYGPFEPIAQAKKNK